VKGTNLLIASMAIALAAMAGCARESANGAPPPPTDPVVTVVHPQRGEIVRTLDLPGDAVGMYETALHAKVTGYLKSISVDKGDWVKRGQVLAVIEVPELHSNLAQAQARLEIQRVTYQRLRRVQQSDPRLVSQEDVDMAFAKYQEAQAAVQTLQTMVDYTQVVAPFDGVITGRFADPGALIRAGGGDFGVNETSGLVSPGATEGAGGHRTGGGPILTIADISELRIYLYVPEQDYPYIQRGMPATLRFDEFPGRVFHAQVARYANSLDLSTRTMLVEIDMPNPGHKVYPRSYAHVTLDLVRHQNALQVPSAAVHGSGDTARVWIVRDGKLALVPVTTGISKGNVVEITSGLNDDSLVVEPYSNTLSAGEKIRTSMAANSAATTVSSAD